MTRSIYVQKIITLKQFIITLMFGGFGYYALINKHLHIKQKVFFNSISSVVRCFSILWKMHKIANHSFYLDQSKLLIFLYITKNIHLCFILWFAISRDDFSVVTYPVPHLSARSSYKTLIPMPYSTQNHIHRSRYTQNARVSQRVQHHWTKGIGDPSSDENYFWQA